MDVEILQVKSRDAPDRPMTVETPLISINSKEKITIEIRKNTENTNAKFARQIQKSIE